MNEDKSKLQLIGEIAQANNKNLELIEEINDREDEIERLNNIIKELEKRLKEGIEDNKKEYSLKSQMAVFVLRDTLELIEDLKEKYEILDKGE